MGLQTPWMQRTTAALQPASRPCTTSRTYSAYARATGYGESSRSVALSVPDWTLRTGPPALRGDAPALAPPGWNPSASARLPLSRRGVFVNAWTVTTALFSTLAAPYSHATHQGVCAVAQNRLGFTEHPPAEFRRIKPLGTGTVHGLSLNGSGVSACLGVQPPDKQSLGRMVNQPTTTVQRDWTV